MKGEEEKNTKRKDEISFLKTQAACFLPRRRSSPEMQVSALNFFPPRVVQVAAPNEETKSKLQEQQRDAEKAEFEVI